MTDRKKPSATFWISVALIAALVGYPLSFGPACWLADRGLIPTTAAVQAYHPLAHALAHSGSDWISSSMTEYGRWGSNRQSGVATMILLERVKMLLGPGKGTVRESF